MADRAEQRRSKRAETRRRYYPETGLDDFSRVDSAVEFYTRVNALLEPGMTAVDFGAGRGQWYVDSTSETRRRLRDMRGKVAKVIGLDVDPAVKQNPSVDEAQVTTMGGDLPLPDASVDVLVSDFTFEHIDDPEHISRELYRVLKPGGWVCARTPNKWGYIGVGARIVPNQWHVRWLTRLQPGRRDIDVFPVRYRLNTRRDLAQHFAPDRFEHIVYTTPGEPSYAGGSWAAWRAVGLLQRFQPRVIEPMMLIFLRKRG